MLILLQKQTISFPHPQPAGASEQMKQFAPRTMLTLKPENNLQTAPEWIRDTQEFKLALEAGLIIEIPQTPGIVAENPEKPEHTAGFPGETAVVA